MIMTQPDATKWHKPFLELLQSMPNIRNALKQVGATRQELVEHRAADKSFDLAVDLAMEDGRDNLRMMLTSQAVGAQQPDGTFKGRSERLLTLVARMHLPEFGGGGGPTEGDPGARGQSASLPLWDTPQVDAPTRPPSDAELLQAAEEVLGAPPPSVEEVAREDEPAPLPLLAESDHPSAEERPARAEQPSSEVAPTPSAGEIPPLFSEAPKAAVGPQLQKWQVTALADIRRRFLEAAERVAAEDKRALPETVAVLGHSLDVARTQGGAVREAEMVVGKIALWCSSPDISAATKKGATTLSDDARLILKTIVRGGI